ncbi:hypothetical protein AO062_12985 [Variovorax boronicumulans]|nr:hypothetical protein AO062_12985 [Variovorax boronicumulans]
MPPEEVVVLALRAYRIAAFEALPAAGDDVWQGGRVQFTEDLEQRFGAFLQRALRDARERHRVNDIPCLERMLETVPPEWMPELEDRPVSWQLVPEPLESQAVGVGAACGRGEATPGDEAKRSEGVQPPGDVTPVTPAVRRLTRCSMGGTA